MITATLVKTAAMTLAFTVCRSARGACHRRIGMAVGIQAEAGIATLGTHRAKGP